MNENLKTVWDNSGYKNSLISMNVINMQCNSDRALSIFQTVLTENIRDVLISKI